MKKIVQVTEVEGEGLLALMGKRVTLYCSAYIYSGELVGVNDKFVQLKNTEIVYDTGSAFKSTWDIAERFPKEGIWYVMTQSIESFGIFK